jgi:hypothetical protein
MWFFIDGPIERFFLFLTMSSFLQRPYPIDKSVPRVLLISALFGLFVFVFLWLFEPFGISNLRYATGFICLLFGAWCSLALLLLNLVVVRSFPRLFRESSWTVGRELLWVTLHCAVIGVGNTAVAVWSGLTLWSWQILLTYEIYTVAVGIFPITISVLLTELRLNRQYQDESREMNSHLPAEHSDAAPALQVTLRSVNKNEDLTVPVPELICLEAADNYVTVYHSGNGHIRKTILRSTLKALEEQLAHTGTMFRAHKSYLINCERIERVSGNAQGYRLHLDGLADPVPVSRKQNEELRRRLASRN